VAKKKIKTPSKPCKKLHKYKLMLEKNKTTKKIENETKEVYTTLYEIKEKYEY